MKTERVREHTYENISPSNNNRTQMDHHNAKAIRGTHPSSDEYNPGVPNLNKLLLISALLN